MADYTPNINLEKPAGNENFRRQVINDNMDKVDNKFGVGAGEGHTHDGTAGQGKRISYNNLEDKPAAMTPTAHKSTHAAGGSDALTPADIGAETPAGAQAKADVVQGNLDAHLAENVQSFDRASGFHSDLAAWYGNTKQLATCEADEAWGSASGCTISADTTNFKIGRQGLRLTEDTTSAGFNAAILSGLTLNMATFDSGEASTDNDYICFLVYVSDYTKLTATGFNLNFSSDVEADTTNRFVSPNVVPTANGWQYVKFQKSAFIVTGAPSWADIKRIRVGWNSATDAQNAYVTFDDIWMCRKDPLADYPNPFQRFGQRDFAINSGEWFVGLEFGEIVMKDLGAGTTSNTALQGSNSYLDFTSQIKIKSGNGSRCRALVWTVNGSNYLVLSNEIDILTLAVVENGVTTNYTVNMPHDTGDEIVFKLNKDGNKVTALAYIASNPNTLYQLSVTTGLTQAGYLAIGKYGNVMQYYSGVSITTTDHAHHADVAEVAKAVSGDIYLKNEDTDTMYLLKLDSDGLYLQEV